MPRCHHTRSLPVAILFAVVTALGIGQGGAMGPCRGSSCDSGGGTTTATISVAANVVSLIGIVTIDDMNFGAVSAIAAGEIVLAADGTVSTTGGASHLAGGQPAQFEISGQPFRDYVLTLPKKTDLTAPGGAKMTVDKFVADQSRTGALDVDGKLLVRLGATLNMSAQQPPGTYTGTFSVTVAQN